MIILEKNPPLPLSLETIQTIAREANVSSYDAERAYKNIRAGKVIGLAVSGKQASGKDTIAPAVLDRMNIKRRSHIFYARPLKDELDMLIGLMREARNEGEAAQAVAATNIPDEQAAQLVTMMWQLMRANPKLGAYDRAPEIRLALQLLGTDIRRAQRDDYWVLKALAVALEALAAGRSVFFTDARFPNEIDGVRNCGIMTVRLEISLETQAERLWKRDGLKLDPKSTSHPSETALDGFERFDIVVDNNGKVEPTVETVAEALTEHALALTE